MPKVNLVNLVMTGLYYGYPPCCINEFCYFFIKPRKIFKRKLHGTGYIPCSECNKKSEEELLQIIAHNRQCETLFPIDDEDSEAV